ncbi:MAG TPA: hypothetical protein VHZ09_19800 [Acidobacteriaceae bacterium]|jgi:hypothetical protein|nr:hypothetical protein [Acidobacteriaceae bacterium]
MNRRRLSRIVPVALLAAAGFLFSPGLRAQEGPLAPQGMEALAAHATFSTDFTFNKSMLDAASQTMPDDLRPLIAKLRSVTVHTFRYSAPGMYGAADLDAVRAQYSGNGWTHWAKTAGNSQSAAATPGAPVSPDPARTDIWVRMDHSNFNGIALLVANERNVNLVVVDGMISPLDLLHLRGHFGIPRFSGNDLEDGQGSGNQPPGPGF